MRTELDVLNTLRVTYSELPQILNRHELSMVAESSRAFGEALLHFGRCERLARSFESTHAAVAEKLTKSELAAIKGLNDRGLVSLKHAVEQLQEAIEADPFPEKKSPARLASAIAEFTGDMLPLLAAEQIKPSDIKKLAILAEDVASVAAKGPKKLLDYILSKMQELIELRQRPDRGAVDNIPIWKVIAIAVFLGLWLVAVIRCLINRNQCSDVANAALAAGMTIAFLVAWFC